jgi:predicted nucleotidyltransferase
LRSCQLAVEALIGRTEWHVVEGGLVVTDRLDVDQEALAELCRRHSIRRLSLFGSVLKGTAGPDSDIDLLVEFEPGCKPGYIGLAGIEIELSALLGGRRVDLRTAEELSRYFREEVVQNARVQYAA